MTKSETEKSGGDQAGPDHNRTQQDKQQRLSKALRDNLRRRKQQARSRKQTVSAEKPINDE